MHVLLVHQVFNLPGAPGGTRHFELARHCVRAGHHFTIVASDLSYTTGKRLTKRKGLNTEENAEGLHIFRAYTYPAIHRGFIWRVVSFLSFMLTSFVAGMGVDKVDLVMGTSPPIFQAVAALLIAKIRRKPFLLEIRDLWPEFAIGIGVLQNPILIRLSRWLEHFLYNRASHVLVNSPAYQDYLISKGIAASRMSLISNGVDTGMFDPEARGEDFRRHWECDGEFVVTYAGALGLANDIPTILRAAHRLKDDEPQIRFVLIGDGKERAKLEKMAKELRLDNITFAGAIAKMKMPDALAASDACIATLKNIPMFKTTYPNKVFDYMAAGRPIILAIDGVIRKVIESAKGGIFVPPENHAALADAVSSLCNNRFEAKTMGAAARSYVVENFDRHGQAQAFANLLEHVHKLARERKHAPQLVWLSYPDFLRSYILLPHVSSNFI